MKFYLLAIFLISTAFLWRKGNLYSDKKGSLTKNESLIIANQTLVTEFEYLDDSYAKRVAKCTPATAGIVINSQLHGANDPQWLVQHKDNPREDPNKWFGPYSGLTYVAPNTSFYKVSFHTDFNNDLHTLTGLRFNNKPREGSKDDHYMQTIKIFNWQRHECEVTVHHTRFGGPVYFSIKILK